MTLTVTVAGRHMELAGSRIAHSTQDLIPKWADLQECRDIHAVSQELRFKTKSHTPLKRATRLP
jgi:hypothetical protein